MAKGQKIDELYISLGLDIARLQLDFDTAGRTVSQTMARLNSESKQLTLKTDIDLTKLEGAGKELDQLKIKYQAINQQLDIQRQKEQILATVVKDAHKTSGEDSGLTRQAETNLLKQQKAIAQMEAEMRRLNVQIKAAGGNATTFGQRMSASIGQAKAGLGSLSSGFNLLSAKMAAVLAIATTGAGLFNITQSAMESGESLYKLTQRLHTSSAEAAKLNRVFAMVGVNVQSITPLMARLDKQILSAGESGNSTTQALIRFGVSLTDGSGALKSMSDQLGELARGYRTAADAGEEEAYVAEVLGARGAGLVPVLEQYTELMEISSHIKTTGLLDPEQAHKTYLKWKEMEMEAGQLKTAFGAALLPVAEELMPDIIEGFKGLIDSIRTNKDDIKELAVTVGEFAKTSVDLLGGVADALEAIGINAKTTQEALSNVGTYARHGGVGTTVQGALVGAGVGFMVGGPVGAGIGAGVGALGTYELATHTDKFKEWQAEDEALKEEKKAAREAEEAIRKNSEAKRENARASRQAALAAEKMSQANAELKEAMANLSRSDLEKSLAGINKEIEKFQQAGASQGLIDEYKAAKQAQIYEDFQHNVVDKTQEIYRSDLANQLVNIDREAEAYRKKGLDEVSATQWAAASKAKVRQQFENEVASRIDSIWQDSLRNRLDEIEREKKAWQQKGVDEVKATQWAEKAKANARRDAALETLRSQKEELEAFRQGGKIGLLKKLREEAGLSAEDLRFTPAELEKFQAARKEAADNLLPQFAVNPHWEQDVGRQDMADTLAQIRASFQGTPEQLARLDGISITAESADRLAGAISDNMAGAMERLNQSQTMGEGNQTINHAPTVNVSVNIDTAVTQDSESMSRLADQVADRITPAVEQALGSGELAY